MKKRKSGNFLYRSTLILALFGLSAMTLVAQQVNSGLKGNANQENAEFKRENKNTTGIGGFEPNTKTETANRTEDDLQIALKDQLLKPSFSMKYSRELSSDPNGDPSSSDPRTRGIPHQRQPIHFLIVTSDSNVTPGTPLARLHCWEPELVR